MEVAVWIGLITSLAAMVKAVYEARKAGMDLEATKNALRKASSGEESSPVKAKLASPFTVKEDLLKAYIEDIRAAHERFRLAVGNARISSEKLQEEADIAQRSICKHLGKVKELNGGQFPSQDLQEVWNSYGCHSVSPDTSDGK